MKINSSTSEGFLLRDQNRSEPELDQLLNFNLQEMKGTEEMQPTISVVYVTGKNK